MTQKYFIGKCGGEDCSQRFKTVKITHSTLSSSYDSIFKCNIDAKENPDCSNCPHGKTIAEMAEYIESEGIVFRSQAKEVIEALLGGEDK